MNSVLVDVAGHPVAATVGAGPEPVVVFISAMGQPLTDWATVIDKLSTGPAALAYDRPGIGRTPPRPAPNPPLPYSAFATELARLLDTLQIMRPVVLVGHSFGSLIARAFAHKWPARVVGVVHVDGGLPTFDLGGRNQESHIDAEHDETGTVIDVDAEAEELAAAAPPSVPTVVLSRAPGWWYPPPAVAPPDQDARWHSHHADLAARSGGVRLVANSAGHQLPRDAPKLVAYAVDAVVTAVRDGVRHVTIAPAEVALRSGAVATSAAATTEP